MKRLLASILIILLLFTFTGCKNETASTQQAVTDTKTEQTPVEKAEQDESESTDKPTEKTEQDKDQNANQPEIKTEFDLSSIPEFSGEPYIIINNNNPQFSEKELTVTSYESYSELDEFGRCGITIASIGKDIMPTEQRGEIGMVKPTGWQTVKYENVDGKYLYNRCHLIGFQLTGENANTKNLITGTRFMNVDGMLPFENMVADYVKETGNHVAYRVTPIFSGTELVARGVQMEGYSIEDKGEGICFNVFCYNAQPDIQIDYATGKSEYKSSEVKKPETTPEAKPEAEATPEVKPETETTPEAKPESIEKERTYIANKNTKKFHYPDCGSVKTMKEENKLSITDTRENMTDNGYEPCKNCNP